MALEDETSIADPSTVTVDDETTISEASIEEEVERFDLHAFMEGIRPGRVTVRLYARPDIEQQITQINQDAFEATMRGDKHALRELNTQKAVLQEAYFKHSIDIVLEERSKEWQARHRLKLKNDGITDPAQVMFHTIAAQIVSPPDAFTGEDLEQINMVIPTQIHLLAEAWASLSRIEQAALPVF